MNDKLLINFIICDKSLQVIAFMVLAIISASLAGVMFCVSMPGVFIGGGEEQPPYVSESCLLTRINCLQINWKLEEEEEEDSIET